MIKSMTGFGRGECAGNSRKFTVEIKAVNHRYLDVNVKMPKSLTYFETAVRGELKNYVSRGKVDVFISQEILTEKTVAVRYNAQIAGEYLKYLRLMGEEFGLEDDVMISSLAKFPEIFSLEESGTDEEELWMELRSAVAEAAERFVESRTLEGGHLKEDLLEKLAGMERQLNLIENRSPQVIAEYRRRLEEKARELLSDVEPDEGRLLTEVMVFADKACVDEETVRLRSHMATMKETLQGGGAVGRKLDFIAQEMNREANTILSKANDLETSACAIELKTEIEKVREQIQNIE